MTVIQNTTEKVYGSNKGFNNLINKALNYLTKTIGIKIAFAVY